MTTSWCSAVGTVDAQAGAPLDDVLCGQNGADGQHVEPESGLGSGAEPDGVQLVGVFVDPGALDAEFARKGGGVNETVTNLLASVVAD